MAVTCGFFNSLNHDRKYNADHIGSLFSGLITDGVFGSIGERFFVKETKPESMNIIVKSGKAWFNNTWTYNDADLLLTVEPSEIAASRYDAVVLEVNKTESIRNNTIKVVKGTPSVNPQKYNPIKTELVNQYVICNILVEPKVTKISQSKIEYVVGTGYTPFVGAILAQFSVEDFLARWEKEMKETIDMQIDDILEQFNTTTTIINNWKNEISEFIEYYKNEQSNFLNWVANNINMDANLLLFLNKIYGYIGADTLTSLSKSDMVYDFLATKSDFKEIYVINRTIFRGKFWGVATPQMLQEIKARNSNKYYIGDSFVLNPDGKVWYIADFNYQGKTALITCLDNQEKLSLHLFNQTTYNMWSQDFVNQHGGSSASEYFNESIFKYDYTTPPKSIALTISSYDTILSLVQRTMNFNGLVKWDNLSMSEFLSSSDFNKFIIAETYTNKFINRVPISKYKLLEIFNHVNYFELFQSIFETKDEGYCIDTNDATFYKKNGSKQGIAPYTLKLYKAYTSNTQYNKAYIMQMGDIPNNLYYYTNKYVYNPVILI